MYEYDTASAGVIPVSDYLEHDQGRGRPFRLKHLGLTFHVLRDCVAAGAASQAIAPLLRSGVLPCIFAESCPYLSNEPSLAARLRESLNSPEAGPVDVDEAVPLYPPGAGNLWHWTFESLPKLLALESAGYRGKYIIPAAAEANPASVIMQSLAMFAIDRSRLLPSGPVYLVRRLTLPQRLSGFSLAGNLPLSAFLREKLLEACGVLEGSRRLYVRRVKRRKVLNEDELLAVLDDFNFERMTPEDLSLREQWRAMTNVDCSLMAHGANSSLTLLQKPGSAAVELFGNRYVSYNNLHSARLLKLRYYPLVEELEAASYPFEQTAVPDFLLQGIEADITLDPLHLRIALESLLG